MRTFVLYDRLCEGQLSKDAGLKRRITQHVTLIASATLMTMLHCAPIFAETPDPKRSSDPSAEHDETSAQPDESIQLDEPSPAESVTWGVWKLKADDLSTANATGNVVATHSVWKIRATHARIRSVGSRQVIDFQGRVRLVRVDQTTPIVIGSTRATVDMTAESVRLDSSEQGESVFFTRASRDWILHAEIINVRLSDGHISLERIGKRTSKHKSPRAALLR